MITLGLKFPGRRKRGEAEGLFPTGELNYTCRLNIFMRFCFRLALGMACVASAALAAGVPDAKPVTSVVRADPRTGKLVRSVVAPRPRVGKTAPAQARPLFHATVARIAAEHSVPAGLIQSVIEVESNSNPYAVSPKGARGLMQLIPSTARRFGVEDVFDPAQNIQGGAKYLRYLLDLFDGDYALTLAAYNAGEGAVARYGAVPPYAETRNYVKLVGRKLEAAAKAAPAPEAKEQAVPVDPDGPSHIREVVESDGSVRYVSR